MEGSIEGALRAGGIGLAAVIGVILLLLWLSRSGGKAQVVQDASLARAVDGRATVRSIAVYDQSQPEIAWPRYDVTLMIAPQGRAAYEYVARWAVGPLGAPNVQIGAIIPVKVDLAHPGLVYPQVIDLRISSQWAWSIMKWFPPDGSPPPTA